MEKGPAWLDARQRRISEELLERMSASAGLSHYGTELRESEEEKASRIIAQEIQKLKFPTIDLDQLSDARKN